MSRKVPDGNRKACTAESCGSSTEPDGPSHTDRTAAGRSSSLLAEVSRGVPGGKLECALGCMLRRISDALIFYCSENSLQCYNESAEPTAELIVRIRSMQPGARE